MYPSFLVNVFTRNDHERRQRRDEAWRAWHRQPDALPLPDEPPGGRAWRRSLAGLGSLAIVARLVGWSQLLRR